MTRTSAMVSDGLRRAICRGLFLLLCVLPTSACCYWMAHPQTPHGWAQAIQANLGVTTEIGAVETPGPFQTVLRDVRLSDPEYGVLLETVEVRIEYGRQIRVVIPYPVNSLNQRGLSCLVRAINQHLIRRGGIDQIWRVEFQQEAVVKRQVDSTSQNVAGNTVDKNDSHASLPTPAQVMWSNLKIDVDPRPDGTLATAHGYLRRPGQAAASAEPVGLGISRGSLGQLLELDTNGVALPCWLIEDLAPEVVSSLGSRAQFVGKLEMVPRAGQSGLFIDGIIDSVAVPAPIDLTNGTSALGRIELDECLYTQGQFANWHAVLEYPGMYPVPIRQEDLFYRATTLDPSQAITRAILQGHSRTAGDSRTFNR